MSKRQGVFISYSKKDAKWLDYLRTHLSYLEREYEFTIWEDSKIEVGSDWRDEINKAINTTKIAILMVSPNFISSEFINNEELPALLTAARDEGAFIFPIIVSHCMFSDIEAISKFQTVNPPTEPLVIMDQGQRDALFVKVTKEIKKVLSAHNGEQDKLSVNQDAITSIKTSFVRVIVMRIFFKNSSTKGLSIKEVHQLSKIEKRKDVVSVIHELEAMNFVDKTKVELVNYYRLNESGTRLVAEYSFKD